jgi:arsenate reductase
MFVNAIASPHDNGKAAGLDLSQHTPRRLTVELADRADVAVTMGCGDACPHVPGERHVDWDRPDRRGRPLEEVRETRVEIARPVDELLREL